mmetsp:Transcript_30990/g.92205  ORF Transcript_30990/g.92205 Transcript_30990/m.92205 type:complete len:486 (-) Transcript_30990:204-1661(-)
MLDPDLVKLVFGSSLMATICVNYLGRNKDAAVAMGAKAKDDHFRLFQRTYLLVYLPAMMADWLQGPFVYALYESYGFVQEENASLFTAGFGASAVLGPFIGSLADRMGRRRFAALYCFLYGASCLTKHANDFSCLMVGRITGGAATSLLFSVFESWMVSEHNTRGFDPELLGSTFSLAVFSNSIVAIAAGVMGQTAADALPLTPLGGGGLFYGGYCSPFDMAIVFLVLSLLLMSMLWPENYGLRGSGTGGGSLVESLCLALRSIRTQPRVLDCGVVCAFFEASMFIFVFMWTPALTEAGAPKPPHGYIFASFMVMSMLGSQIFSLQAGKRSVEEIGRAVLVVAALSHAVPVLTSDTTLRYGSFLLFELCVGVYFPMSGTLKGSIVPEESRSAIYNLFRMPLNIIVVMVLALKIELQTAFITTTVLLLAAVLFQTRLVGSRSSGAGPYRRVGADAEFGLDDEMPLGDPDGSEDKSDELATMLGNRS